MTAAPASGVAVTADFQYATPVRFTADKMDVTVFQNDRARDSLRRHRRSILVQTYSFSFANASLAFLLTVTRSDETVIRVCGWPLPITIGSVTWTPAVGLKLGDVTNTNDGTLPTYSFDISADSAGAFTPLDIDLGLFESALVGAGNHQCCGADVQGFFNSRVG